MFQIKIPHTLWKDKKILLFRRIFIAFSICLVLICSFYGFVAPKMDFFSAFIGSVSFILISLFWEPIVGTVLFFIPPSFGIIDKDFSIMVKKNSEVRAVAMTPSIFLPTTQYLTFISETSNGDEYCKITLPGKTISGEKFLRFQNTIQPNKAEKLSRDVFGWPKTDIIINCNSNGIIRFYSDKENKKTECSYENYNKCLNMVNYPQ